MPTLTRLQLDQGAQTRRTAEFRPHTFSDADSSVEVVWTTGAAVVRFDWYDGEYYVETLSTKPGHVRLDRLNEGGPVLVDHETSVSALVGSIIPGSVRLEAGKGYARIRLTDTPDMADVVAKVKAGHLRTVSVAYSVWTWERSEGERGERPQLHAIDWEPLEISLVTVPADPGAIIRSRSNEMPEALATDARDDRDPDPKPARGDHRTVSEGDILVACSRADASRVFERALLDRHEEQPLTKKELRDEMARHLAGKRTIDPIDHFNGDGWGASAQHTVRSTFADALYARLSGKEPPEAARQFAGAPMVEIMRSLLEKNGERARWLRAPAVVDMALRHGAHTTSDFAYIIDSAAKRYLADMFRSAPSPLKTLARKRNFSDFRERVGVSATGPTVLRAVPENAEYQHVSFKENRNGYRLNTFGEIFSISRQALINDDLGVFSQMAMFWARAQAETEASYFVAMIAGTGEKLSGDNTPLYDAAHGNIASAAALSVASLSAARQQMRGMKNSDGQTFANVVPKYLTVGPALETAAEQVLAMINANSPAEVNPFSGKLELLVEPRLSGNSWRLFADPQLHPVLEYGNLEGQEGLHTDTRIGFEVDGVEYKARIDLGVGLVDYRGTLMNPGA